MRRILIALAAVLVVVGLLTPSAGAYSNGYLPESALAPIASGVKCEKPAGQLENHAAASFNSMALAAGRKLTINGCDSAYRPYLRQVYWRTYWCALGQCFNAAVPGLSNHGLGRAIDVPTWVQGWIRLHGKRFGWLKTEAFTEPWHWTFVGDYNRPDPGPNLHSPTLRLHSGGPGQNIYVRKVQKLLRGHGFKQLPVTGSYDAATVRVVRHFQKAQRIPKTGVVSPRVWKRLRQPVSKPVPTTPKHVPKHTHQPPATKHPKPHPSKPPRKPKGPAWGIDISSAQGTVDFKAARKDGASFAITKATEGTSYRNPYFGRAQIEAIGKAGMVPGVYDFIVPTADHSGKAEAAFFTAAVGAAGYGKGFLPPVADIESTELGDAGTCHYLGEWVHLVKRNLGVKPIIYTFPSFPASYMAGCSWLRHYTLWIAHPGASRPSVPAPWKDWAIWQYSWTGRVAGVSGDVDLNKVFHGRRALVEMRVKELPKRARVAPRAALDLPLAAGPLSELREAAPEPAEETPLSEVPAPEGDLEPVAAAAPGSPEVMTGTAPSIGEAIAELIHALAVAIGG